MAYMGLSALTGIMKARAGYKSGMLKAAAHQFNAEISNRNYQFSLVESQQRTFLDDLQIKKFIKEQKQILDNIDMANRSNGWIASTGTPLKVAMASAMDMDEEVAIAKYNSQVAQQKIEQQGLQDKLQGSLQSMYASNQRSAARTGFTTSLLGTATNIAMIKAYG